jgi:hypothetical protein
MCNHRYRKIGAVYFELNIKKTQDSWPMVPEGYPEGVLTTTLKGSVKLCGTLVRNQGPEFKSWHMDRLT